MVILHDGPEYFNRKLAELNFVIKSNIRGTQGFFFNVYLII
jgi:hypothetical protein